MRASIGLLLAVALLTGCGDDLPDTEGKPDTPSVIEDLSFGDRDLNDFDLCTAVRDIEDFDSRAADLLGSEVEDVRAYPDELRSSGQKCNVITDGTRIAMTFAATQGPDEATEVGRKDTEVYPGCFASSEQGEGPAVGARCSPNFSIGLSVRVEPKTTSWPADRDEYLTLLADLISALSKQG